ncbi:amino acid transporter [Aspergillus homomorphus CBS 101889]|uniref:Amino acid transporter n=1 Tax=Aspergillus homomorphus (strain CBS 101889) TaxID=1450537 RepID=A0A395HGW1_ASPHC|nr:amino acid transporter [Aspergillus homomorphus CBS 101889]RAL06723.1 amino acid transporter [Aspergillus homomorphus CBS 101889]
MADVKTNTDQTLNLDPALQANKTRAANIDHADAQLAQEFGYKPVFKREFGYLSTFSFAVSISGLFATVMTTMVYPLEAGGSSAVIWCWLISGAGCLCLACSVAELVSAYPTSGGLYFTISRLVPEEWVPSISWYVLTGWLNLLGQVCGVASSEYGAAQMLLAVVSMSRDFDYEITTGTTVGVMAALTISTGLINSLSTYWMEKITKFYVIFHVLVLVSCSIALLAMTENKNDASYVFTHVESTSGWQPIGFSFLFGFLSVSWTMTDYDATAHITEEISNPEIKAPWAISLAMLFTYLAGFLFNIVLCFCMGDPSGILSSPTEQPVAQLFYNSLGKAGGIFFTICALLIIKFVTFTAMQALGRTVFAFSRDRMLPFSNVWMKVTPLTGTPLNAVWISVFLCIAINLIALGSYTAISAVFTLCSIALDWSYCIPVLCKLFFGKFKPGPWHMGRFSTFINAWACVWTLFVSVIFVLPTARPVTASNMNYACVFLVFVLLFALVYWYISGKRFYHGPVTEAVVGDYLSESNSTTQAKADKTGSRV